MGEMNEYHEHEEPKRFWISGLFIAGVILYVHRLFETHIIWNVLAIELSCVDLLITVI